MNRILETFRRASADSQFSEKCFSWFCFLIKYTRFSVESVKLILLLRSSKVDKIKQGSGSIQCCFTSTIYLGGSFYVCTDPADTWRICLDSESTVSNFLEAISGLCFQKF